jgi:hypothetical protein
MLANARQLTPSCEDFAAALTVRVDGSPVRWTIHSRQSEWPMGRRG